MFLPRKKTDAVILIVLPILSAAGAIQWQMPLIINELLFFGLPALWLSCRNQRYISRALHFALSLGLPLSFILDYLATKDNAWSVSSIFPWRLLEVVSVENILYGTLFFYAVVLFYHHINSLSKNSTPGFYKPLYYTVLLAVGVLLLMHFLTPQTLVIPYAYLYIGLLLCLLPMGLALFLRPNWRKDIFAVLPYFFYLNLLFELTALRIGNWFFPGQHYIGRVIFFNYQLPLEELVFWCLLSAPAVVTYWKVLGGEKSAGSN